jgi:hypothetical protein
MCLALKVRAKISTNDIVENEWNCTSTPKDISTVKDKVNPLNAWTGPKLSRKFRLPVERKSVMKVVWFSALAPAAFTPRKYSWCSFFVRG